MPQTFNVGARSLFVTATAWAFIALAALASACALLQNAAVASLVPNVQAWPRPMPLLTGLLLSYLPWVVGAGLVISLATLKRHLSNLYLKLGVHSRTQALARASEWQLL